MDAPDPAPWFACFPCKNIQSLTGPGPSYITWNGWERMPSSPARLAARHILDLGWRPPAGEEDEGGLGAHASPPEATPPKPAPPATTSRGLLELTDGTSSLLSLIPRFSRKIRLSLGFAVLSTKTAPTHCSPRSVKCPEALAVFDSTAPWPSPGSQISP